MGEIGCRRPHSTKLVDIRSEIFVESALDLCAFIYEAPNDVICMAAPVTACYSRLTRHFIDVTHRNGVCLCACGCFGRTLGLNVRVHGGCFVATNSQIDSHESGMPFDSL